MSMSEFTAKPAVRQEEPLLLGFVGPPGGGKSMSALLVAKGIQDVRGGPIIVIDTEGGRSRKYADVIPFEIIEFQPPCRSERFLEAIRAQLAKNPAAIIVDSLSDEHEGEGGYLEWHDEMVPKMGNNEWAAWSKPKASRKKLISGILHIKTPLIFTFRAREKTAQKVDSRGKKEVVNIGWQPVAPLEIVHTLDLVCLLPPRAEGIPVWKSEKVGEDFVIKLPQYLKPFIGEGKPLSADMGRAFAEWASGGTGASAADLIADAKKAAAKGKDALQAHWKALPQTSRAIVKPAMDELKAIAKAADEPDDDPFGDPPSDSPANAAPDAGTPSPAEGAAGRSADPLDWSLEDCEVFGREQRAAGITRKAVVPPELRVQQFGEMAAAVLAGWDGAAATTEAA